MLNIIDISEYFRISENFRKVILKSPATISQIDSKFRAKSIILQSFMFNNHIENEECCYLFILKIHESNYKHHIFVGEVIFINHFNIRNLEVASTTIIFSDIVSRVSPSTGFIVVSENFELISENSKLAWTIQKLQNATI